jgi:SAM-dependent methyltransferase
MTRTDTAHLDWDERWRTGAGRADWLEPEADVEACARDLRTRGAVAALDLGSGVGRHALMLAAMGFETSAIDASAAGLERLAASAARAGLRIDARQGLMTKLPFGDASVDYVLSFNVLYHGDEEVVRRAFAEIVRVLRPGGTFQGTMLSARHVLRGTGREISRNTFVIDGDEDDKSHPHHYCAAAALIALMAPMQVRSLVDREQRRPGNWHWHVVAERV